MNVDRYITYPVVRDACLRLEGDTPLQDAEMVLRAALPGILAAHRADVLIEAAEHLTRNRRHILDPSAHKPCELAVGAGYNTAVCELRIQAHEAGAAL